MTTTELLNLRRGAGLTQKALAGELGVDLDTVWRWENGRRRIPELAARLIRRVKGFREIAAVIGTIDAEQAATRHEQAAA